MCEAFRTLIEAILDGRRGSELWAILAPALQMSELTIAVKMKIFKNLLSIGWREPKREGLVLLSRILFGMSSLLAALEAEADWRALVTAA